MVYDLQKADTWKRISAFIFDKILVFTLAVGVAFILSFILDFGKYSDLYNSRAEAFNTEYKTDVLMSEEDYNALGDADKEYFDFVYEKWSKDADRNYAMAMIQNLTLITLIFSLLIAYIVLEFILPLILRNGQTLGKKIFSVGVMRIDGVKISTFILFVRSILGKYTLELMLPILLFMNIFYAGPLAPIIAVAVLLFTIGAAIFTKNHTPPHDLLASTVTVDMASQLIFDSPEALLEYKQQLHNEMAERAEY